MRPRRMWPVAAPVFLTSALLFILGAGAGWSYYAAQRDASVEFSDKVAHVLLADELVLTIREMRGNLGRFIIDGDRKAMGLVPECLERIRSQIDALREVDASAREKSLLTQVEQNISRFSVEFDRTLKTNHDKVLPGMVGLRNAVLADILPPAGQLLAINHAQINELDARNVLLSQRMAIGLLLLGVCGGLGGLLSGYGMSRAISRNLVQLSVPIRSAAGKLDEVVGPLTFSASHSFEELNQVLEQMANRVGQVVEHLQESRQQVMRAEQLAAVGQLAAGLAHELRNPLTSVKILVQSAAERPVPGLRSPRDLAVLEEEIGRMEQLITMFLDFARPPTPNKRLLDLRADVEHVLEVVRSRAERIGAHLDAPLPQHPVMLAADSMQMRQLLMNLTLNALDTAGPGGNVWLSIDDEDVEPPPAENGRPATPWLSLRVSDDGHGLPAELGSKIFDPFVSTKETGIGLGLSICRRIAEAHGGDIEAIDRPGGGAIFIVRLPMEQSPAAGPAASLTAEVP